MSPERRAQIMHRWIFDNWNVLRDVLVVLLFGSVGGAISGAFVANYFTNQRHRKHRKTVLFAFLKVWESEVEANRPAITPSNVAVNVAGQFDERRLVLIEKAASIEFDFSGSQRTNFQTLVNKIAKMTPGKVGDEQGRAELLTAIGELISFLNRFRSKDTSTLALRNRDN